MSVSEIPSSDWTPRAPLPRGLVIVLGIASGVIVLAGMRAVQGIVAPIFMAVALTVTVYPLRPLLQRKGVPRWLATLLVILGVYAILLFLVGAAIIGIARLADLLPQYSDQIQASLNGIANFLGKFGITPDSVKQMLHNISPSSVAAVVGGLLSIVASGLSIFIFLIALVLFMGLDSAMFTTRMRNVDPARRRTMEALGAFAIGTRKYFVVSSIFGGIVAILDTIGLLILGVPAAVLWGVVSFVTNYIPNVGFIIGLIPPALLALVTGGVGSMVAVIILYCALNLVIQSVLQPKFVGDAVGLTTTVSFLSLIVWAFVLGPIGAILAVPMTLLVKALLVDFDPDARWLQLFLGDKPDLSSRKERRELARQHAGAAALAANQAATAAASAADQAAQAIALLDEDASMDDDTVTDPDPPATSTGAG